MHWAWCKCDFICKQIINEALIEVLCHPERNAIALVWAVGQFRSYLLGRPFTVQTDHSALQWLYSFKGTRRTSGKVAGIVSTIGITVQHRPGKKHTNADAFSCIPC
eukprot:Em0015g925a